MSQIERKLKKIIFVNDKSKGKSWIRKIANLLLKP